MSDQFLLPDVDLDNAGLYEGKLTRDDEMIAHLHKIILKAKGLPYTPENVIKHWAGMPSVGRNIKTEYDYKIVLYCKTQGHVDEIIKELGLRITKYTNGSHTAYYPDIEISHSHQYTFGWEDEINAIATKIDKDFETPAFGDEGFIPDMIADPESYDAFDEFADIDSSDIFGD